MIVGQSKKDFEAFEKNVKSLVKRCYLNFKCMSEENTVRKIVNDKNCILMKATYMDHFGSSKLQGFSKRRSSD